MEQPVKNSLTTCWNWEHLVKLCHNSKNRKSKWHATTVKLDHLQFDWKVKCCRVDWVEHAISCQIESDHSSSQGSLNPGDKLISCWLSAYKMSGRKTIWQTASTGVRFEPACMSRVIYLNTSCDWVKFGTGWIMFGWASLVGTWLMCALNGMIKISTSRLAASHTWSEVVIVSIIIGWSRWIEICLWVFGSFLFFVLLETCSSRSRMNASIPCRVVLKTFVRLALTVEVSPAVIWIVLCSFFETIAWQFWIVFSCVSHGRTSISFLMETDDTSKQVVVGDQGVSCLHIATFFMLWNRLNRSVHTGFQTRKSVENNRFKQKEAIESLNPLNELRPNLTRWQKIGGAFSCMNGRSLSHGDRDDPSGSLNFGRVFDPKKRVWMILVLKWEDERVDGSRRNLSQKMVIVIVWSHVEWHLVSLCCRWVELIFTNMLILKKTTQKDWRSRWAVCSYCLVFHAINPFCQVGTRTFSKSKNRRKRRIQPKRNDRFFETRKRIEPKLDITAGD